MPKILSLVITCGMFFVPSILFAGPLETFFLNVQFFPSLLYNVNVRVGIQEPDGNPIGDILYLHGFGDRLDNHAPLFDEWNRAGFRVISFDYPSHGETTGTSINFFTFKKLAELATIVEAKTRPSVDRPLILAGWSTGGLLALRMIQSPHLPKFERSPVGMILYEPGIFVYTIVGEPNSKYPFGEVTVASMTHNPNPPMAGEIKPKSPGSVPIFSSFLVANALVSPWQDIPKGLPTLFFVSGNEEDHYVDSESLVDWIRSQMELNPKTIFGVQLPGAEHWGDSELESLGGPTSRAIAAEFARGVVKGNDLRRVNFNRAPCRRILE